MIKENKKLTKQVHALRRGKRYDRGSEERGKRVERHPAWLKILAASLANYKHSAYIVSRPKDSRQRYIAKLHVIKTRRHVRGEEQRR